MLRVNKQVYFPCVVPRVTVGLLQSLLLVSVAPCGDETFTCRKQATERDQQLDHLNGSHSFQSVFHMTLFLNHIYTFTSIFLWTCAVLLHHQKPSKQNKTLKKNSGVFKAETFYETCKLIYKQITNVMLKLSLTSFFPESFFFFFVNKVGSDLNNCEMYAVFFLLI